MDSSIALGVLGARSYGRTTLEHGESAFVALSWGGHAPTTMDEADEQIAATEEFWRDWLSMANFPDHRFRPYIERSALALKGLSYAPTGAIMAAGTTSLPETPGGERNWDYRYTWIRDTAFMLRALHGARLRLGGLRVLRLHPRRGRAGKRRQRLRASRSCTGSAARPT